MVNPDWSNAPVFGDTTVRFPIVVRPSVYVLIEDPDGMIAVVRTPKAVWLPGGGVEASESREAAAIREAREECGLAIGFDAWSCAAVQHVEIARDNAHYLQHCTFHEAHVIGPPGEPTEEDHELVWVSPDDACRMLIRESQCWAVQMWRQRSPPTRAAAPRAR